MLDPGLYFVATPIGNLGDLSHRAKEVLETADRLYAEDTRHSKKLLNHLGIERKLIPCHDHNEANIAPEVCHAVAEGLSCAFISDAGTPGISDPGFRLARACRKEKLLVVPIPGPNAAIAALSVSGLPTDQFRFFGFLPPKKAARLRTFSEFSAESATLVFFESTHRITKFIDDAKEVFGPNRVICIARELTKQFETFHVGTIEEVYNAMLTSSHKGEFVVMVAKADYVL